MPKLWIDHDGLRYPRVSRILSIMRDPGLEKAGQITEEADERSAKARSIGTKLHQMIQQDLERQTVKVDPKMSFELRSCWDGYQRWKQERCKPFGDNHQIEQRLFHVATPRYTCQPDLAEWNMTDRILRVTEWKTSLRIKDLYWIQMTTAVPMLLLATDLSQWTIQLRVVRFDKALGDYEEQVRALNPLDIDTFRYLASVYWAWYSHELQEEER